MQYVCRDTDFILSQRNLAGVISLAKKHTSVGGKKEKKKEDDLVRSLFSQLSKRMVQALYEKYRIDFQMFEYDVSDYVVYASESEGLMPDTIQIQADIAQEEAEEEVTEEDSVTEEP